MTTHSFKTMRFFIASLLLTAMASILILSSCQKDGGPIQQHDHPSHYTSNVLDKWITMQLRLMRNASGIPNHGFSRHFAYSGIAALESLKPGSNDRYSQLTGKWNGLTGLPVPKHAKRYYSPASVNAALAAINKTMFPNASAVDKAAIDSLESALQIEFSSNQPASVITLSIEFGKAVAAAVFNWAETDGYKNANNPYTIPVGPGLWKPIPPTSANPATPYWGNNRTIIYGSTHHAQPQAPVAYSANPGSAFYQMNKEIYDAWQVLTEDQKAMATFWRDVPGTSSPGHWLSILQQVIKQRSTGLEKAALVYALTGAAVNDALIACFKAKYQYNLIRPITYIREEMGYAGWSSFLGTPAHPEYPSAHSSLSMAAAKVMEELLGNRGSFTDHTYDYMGFAPRTYSSFTAIAREAGLSRFYAGIHYKPSIDAGLWQGSKVTANIFSSYKHFAAD